MVTADFRCWLQANKVWPRPGSVSVWCKQSQDVFHWETLFLQEFVSYLQGVFLTGPTLNLLSVGR